MYRVTHKNCSQLSIFFSFFHGFGACFFCSHIFDRPTKDLLETVGRSLIFGPWDPWEPLKDFSWFHGFSSISFLCKNISVSYNTSVQILSKPIGKKVSSLGPVAGPKAPIFSLATFDMIWVYHLKQRKIPRRWPKGLLCKVRITCTKWI